MDYGVRDLPKGGVRAGTGQDDVSGPITFDGEEHAFGGQKAKPDQWRWEV